MQGVDIFDMKPLDASRKGAFGISYIVCLAGMRGELGDEWVFSLEIGGSDERDGRNVM